MVYLLLFGDVIVRNETKTLQKSVTTFEYLYYNIITVIYALACILIMPFIKIYTQNVQDVNYYIPILGLLFVINGVLSNMKTPQGMLVISAGLYKETRVNTTVQALILIIAGIILTPMCGIIGVLIASILSHLYRCIDLLLFIPKNLTHLPIKETLKRQFKIIINMIIVCVPFIFIKVQPANYIEWFGVAVLIGVCILLEVIIVDILFDKEQLKNSINKIKLIVGGKNAINS